MANASAVQVSATLRYSANKASASLATSYTIDQQGNYYSDGIASIGTTEESLDKGDVVNIGLVAVRNMDLTNFVQLGSTTGVYSLKLQPGEGFVGRWNANTVFIKANTAACNVEFLIIEA